MALDVASLQQYMLGGMNGACKWWVDALLPSESTIVDGKVSQWGDLSIDENGARRNRHSTQPTAAQRLAYVSTARGPALYGERLVNRKMIVHDALFTELAGEDTSYILAYENKVISEETKYYEALEVETLTPNHAEISCRELNTSLNTFRFSGGPVSINAACTPTNDWKTMLVVANDTSRTIYRDGISVLSGTLNAPALTFSGTKYGYHLGQGYGSSPPANWTAWQALFKPPGGVSMETLETQVRAFVNKRHALTGQAAQGW
jgi:hypothetical protein